MKEYYEFSNQVKVITGEEGYIWGSKRLHRMGGNDCFLITDSNLKELGIVDKFIEKFFLESGIRLGKVYYIDVVIPTTEDVDNLYVSYRESGCDSIIALGGSRVLNVAKCLNLLLQTNSRDIREYVGIDCAIKRKVIPFGVFPTTFGSGKEVSKTAIIVSSKDKKPLEIVSEVLQPDFCIINSELLKTLPPQEIYLSAINALVYDIEAYISKRTNVLTQSFAKMSMFVIRSNFQNALTKKDDESFYALHRAAALAAIASSNTYMGLIHTIANVISAKYNIRSIYVVISVLKSSLALLKDVAKKEYSQMLLYSLGAKEYASLDENTRNEAFINLFTNMTEYISSEYGIKLGLSSYGISKDDISHIAEAIEKEGSLVASSRIITKEDLIAILENSL